MVSDKIAGLLIVITVLVVTSVFFLLSNFGYITGGFVLFPTFAKECKIDFEVKASGIDTCIFKSYLTTKNCEYPSLTVKQNSCTGNFICENELNFDSVKSTCAWADRKGTYSYVLCDGDKTLLTRTVSC